MKDAKLTQAVYNALKPTKANLAVAVWFWAIQSTFLLDWDVTGEERLKEFLKESFTWYLYWSAFKWVLWLTWYTGSKALQWLKIWANKTIVPVYHYAAKNLWKTALVWAGIGYVWYKNYSPDQIEQPQTEQQ
jgi:hypothetical protein